MNSTKNLVRSSLLLAIAIIFQLAFKNSSITGPVVNAILLLTTFICGTIWGIGIGLLTPILAFATGILNPVLGPFVPFIMIGNALLILIFGILKTYKNYGSYLGVILGAFVKYIFLYTAATKLIPLFKLSIPTKVIKNLIIVMGVPQFYHALIGGAMAIFIVTLLKRRQQID